MLLSTHPPPIEPSHLHPPITLVIIGAGERGSIYAGFANLNPLLAKVVAVCEPRINKRNIISTVHNLPSTAIFDDYSHLLTLPTRIADAVVVCTLDALHADIVVALAEKGYHILCEKPMATSAVDCVRMARAVEKAGVIFGVCHVLRYSPYFRAVKREIRKGRIGDVINITHVEPVGWYHYAHSYVRGNWAKEADTSFSLMTKSCHDIDMLLHLFHPHKALKVSSFGSLNHFTAAKKPLGAKSSTRCLDCPVERSCPYSAVKVYLDPIRSKHHIGWPISVAGGDDLAALAPNLISPTATREDREKAWRDIEDLVTTKLQYGPYGKCVYHSNNDVCDNQVVSLLMEGGRTATFSMVAFTESICQRSSRIAGSRGEIVGDMTRFRLYDFGSRKGWSVTPSSSAASDELPAIDRNLDGLSTDDAARAGFTGDFDHDAADAVAGDGGGGHGGGDHGIMRSFVRAVATKDQRWLGCTVREAMDSHLLVFAAEEARRNGTVVDVLEFTKRIEAEVEAIEARLKN
ncbi:hypothetical protein BC829DRAFT_397458 [Chytridium lagenaria]|nr:hypothetical protein BC829DRAFT_397458 [Chytridium lagenaria]